MTNDFGEDWAAELADYFISGTDVTPPPTDVYVTLYDDAGNELDASLQNGRVAVSPGAGFDQGADTTQFENAAEINFGENTSGGEITVQEAAIKDQDADDATALEYYRGDIQNAPQNFADATRVFLPAGSVSFNNLDQTND